MPGCPHGPSRFVQRCCPCLQWQPNGEERRKQPTSGTLLVESRQAVPNHFHLRFSQHLLGTVPRRPKLGSGFPWPS